MEDDVYVCTWKQSHSRFVLWVKAQPQWRGEGSSYDEAERRLIDAIQDAGGAMHAVLEFDPPLPKSTLEAKYCTPELLLAVGDDLFVTVEAKWSTFEEGRRGEDRLAAYDAFYQAPICRRCRYASTRRSEKPLELVEAPSRFDGGFGRVGRDCRSTHQILSEAFLDLLTSDERDALEVQPVVWKGRRKFFELVGPAGPPLVAAAGLPLSGWRCEACDYRVWGQRRGEFSIREFVAHADLPATLPSVFTVGSLPEIQLGVTAARWRELVGSKGTRGFVTTPLGVTPDRETVRRPELPTQEEALEENRRRNEEFRQAQKFKEQ